MLIVLTQETLISNLIKMKVLEIVVNHHTDSMMNSGKPYHIYIGTFKIHNFNQVCHIYERLRTKFTLNDFFKDDIKVMMDILTDQLELERISSNTMWNAKIIIYHKNKESFRFELITDRS